MEGAVVSTETGGTAKAKAALAAGGGRGGCGAPAAAIASSAHTWDELEQPSSVGLPPAMESAAGRLLRRDSDPSELGAHTPVSVLSSEGAPVVMVLGSRSEKGFLLRAAGLGAREAFASWGSPLLAAAYVEAVCGASSGACCKATPVACRGDRAAVLSCTPALTLTTVRMTSLTACNNTGNADRRRGSGFQLTLLAGPAGCPGAGVPACCRPVWAAGTRDGATRLSAGLSGRAVRCGDWDRFRVGDGNRPGCCSSSLVALQGGGRASTASGC